MHTEPCDEYQDTHQPLDPTTSTADREEWLALGQVMLLIGGTLVSPFAAHSLYEFCIGSASAPDWGMAHMAGLTLFCYGIIRFGIARHPR